MEANVRRIQVFVILLFSLWLVGCSATSNQAATAVSDSSTAVSGNVLTLPPLSPVALEGRPLKVVASTSIIGDVVGRVGGEAIDLTTLMGPGQDPHSYEPGAQELTAVADADVIFVNGWDLEETLARNLEKISGDVPVVPISANIEPRIFADTPAGAADDHDHDGRVDPHVWFSIENVKQWVKNTEQVLSSLDPANKETYQKNAAAYLSELADLEKEVETKLAQIPSDKRFLVTNHNAFGYFARDYDFTVLGTVIPNLSSLAEPSASDLAMLSAAMEEHGICTIFTETTANETLAKTVAAEVSGCPEVKVIPLFTGALGAPGSGADSYIGMYRANVDAIVSGLAPAN